MRKELKALRRRVKEIERDKVHQADIEQEKEKNECALRQRVKELNCLYSVIKLIERYGNSIEKIMQGIANLLPGAWQYPEITCARVLFEDKEYVTQNYKTSKWKQAADITVGGRKVGSVEVYYLKKRPVLYEGPFLKEERLLIDAIAKHICEAAERFKLRYFLQERIKELCCLYEVSRLIDTHGNELEKILQGTARLLSKSWQYPEITCARVVLANKAFLSENFAISQWKQAADITTGGQKIGAIEVYYLQRRPESDEGPFLTEERFLIDAVAEHIGGAYERIMAQQQLEAERAALKKANIAMREVLNRIHEEKKEMGARIKSNADKVIMPILYALEKEKPPNHLQYVRLLKGSLEEIISPFTNNLSKEFMSLSSTEIQICNLIKNGLSSKEIAQLRGISGATVSRHREHIRKKLGIINKNINLAAYLQIFESEVVTLI